jgi:hypothetical protein
LLELSIFPPLLQCSFFSFQLELRLVESSQDKRRGHFSAQKLVGLKASLKNVASNQMVDSFDELSYLSKTSNEWCLFMLQQLLE